MSILSFPLPENQPSDAAAEQVLIGAVGLYGASVLTAVLREVPDLTDDDFTHPWHALTWRAAMLLYRDGRAVNLITVVAEMRQHGVPVEKEMHDYLVDATQSLVAVQQVPDCARIIRDRAERRALIALAQELAQDAGLQSGDPAPASELRQRMVGALVRGCRDGALEPMGKVARRIRARMDSPPDITPTGFPRLDRACGGGFHAGRLYGFQARPKGGKSTLMASISWNLFMRGENPVPHAFFAAEMSPDEIAQAMVGRYIDVHGDAFRYQNHAQREKAVRMFDQTMAEWERKGLWFYGKPRMQLDDLKEKMARLCYGGKIKGAFVDYIQIIGGKQKGQSSAEFYDDVGQTLAELAKRYNIWICTAAQLNREGETRYGDGLLMSCDRVFDMHRLTDTRKNDLWLEGLASRYTDNMDVGDPNSPAFRLVTSSGPYFERI